MFWHKFKKNISSDDILNVLRELKNPGSDTDIVSANMVSSAIYSSGAIKCVIELGSNLPAKNISYLEQNIQDILRRKFRVDRVDVVTTSNHNVCENNNENVSNTKAIPGVKKIIAIGAGKGGVGKSMVTACLAVCLSEMGFKVGLVDADIYGPSIPAMFGINKEPDVQDGNIIPINAFGVQVVSIGLLVRGDTATIWRGPMATKALHQLMRGVAWPELDYLLIDLPPGTGDIHLSLLQQFNIDGAIVVTTPSVIAINDCFKAINMFKKLNVGLFGVVENMTYLEDGDRKIYVFGRDVLEQKFNDEIILSSIPLLPNLRERLDNGLPYLAFKENEKYFTKIAEQII